MAGANSSSYQRYGGLWRGSAACPRRTSSARPRPPSCSASNAYCCASLSTSVRAAVLPTGTPLHQQPAQLLVGQVGVGVHLVGLDERLHQLHVGLDRVQPERSGTRTPGGGHPGRSTSRRLGRRRSGAAILRAGPPPRCAPSAACCRRCGGRNLGSKSRTLSTEPTIRSIGIIWTPSEDSPTTPNASITAWNDSALRSSASFPRNRAASPASTCLRRALRKSCSASARGEPVSRRITDA